MEVTSVFDSLVKVLQSSALYLAASSIFVSSYAEDSLRQVLLVYFIAVHFVYSKFR